MFSLRTCLATFMAVAPLAALAQESVQPPFSRMAAGPVPKPWHFASLPNKAHTDFSIVSLEGQNVLRVATADAYGNLVFPLHLPPTPAIHLQWRWRVDELISKADIRQRSGDDSALKLCVSFDFDKSQLSWGERAKLRMGKVSTGEDIPAETLCYVWDNQLPAGSSLHNAFTHRMRYIVLQSGTTHLGQWMQERRDLAADYTRTFGDESPQGMPDVLGITVSADSDNTHASGLAYMGDIHLER